MKLRLAAFFLALATVALSGADLTTRDGQVYRNYKVIGHDTGYLTIMYADGGGKIPLSKLPAALQAQYGYDPAKSIAYVAQDEAAERQARMELAQAQAAQHAAAEIAAASHPPSLQPAPTPLPQPLTGMAAKFDGHLILMRGNQAQDLDAHTLANVKYWAFYYSASWCPPCRAFTPSLVSFYRGFKPTHPDFELVFVNDDHTEDDMLSYMQEDGMPWPAVRYSDIPDASLQARKFCGNGIPCLVLVDSDGNVLSDTNRNGQYMGPEVVVDDIKSMVK